MVKAPEPVATSFTHLAKLKMLNDEDKHAVQNAGEGKSHWLLRESYAPTAASRFTAYFADISGLRLLDAGCAQGHDLQRFVEFGVRAEGIDNNREFLIEARKLFPDIKISEGDVELLPFADGTFDLVYCRNVIFYTHPEKSIAELQRVLRSGGIGHITLDEKIVKLEDESIIHAADIQEMCSILDSSEILSQEYRERVDEMPWRHRHHYYDVYFRKD